MNGCRVASLWTLGIASILATGCGESTGNLQAISGTIKFKGAPLDQGIIEFTPVGAPTIAGDAASKSGTSIENGNYQIPVESGLVPGKYKVFISSGDGVNIEKPDEPPGPTGNYVSRERIPAEFNSASGQEIEVKLGGNNVFSFDIP